MFSSHHLTLIFILSFLAKEKGKRGYVINDFLSDTKKHTNFSKEVNFFLPDAKLHQEVIQLIFFFFKKDCYTV